MRKTKIICTIGPASENPEVFREKPLAADLLQLGGKVGDVEEIEAVHAVAPLDVGESGVVFHLHVEVLWYL